MQVRKYQLHSKSYAISDKPVINYTPTLVNGISYIGVNMIDATNSPREMNLGARMTLMTLRMKRISLGLDVSFVLIWEGNSTLLGGD